MADQTSWTMAVETTLARLCTLPGALLPILREIQDQVGYVPAEAVPRVAEVLNLSRAEVHGVLTFYHDFRSEPAGRHVVHVCRAESCQALGAEALLAGACERLGVDVHGTTADGSVTLEPIYCLGNCALSPAVMVDRQVYGRVTQVRLNGMLDTLQGAMAR
jgi:formate dehydrogenase subunit gamma